MTGQEAEEGKGCVLVLGIAFGAAGAWLYFDGRWIVGSVAALLALLLFVAVFSKAKGPVAQCPYCFATIKVFAAAAPEIQCAGCWEYFVAHDNALHPLDPSTVSETPQYETPLFANARWPNACVGCGDAPTRFDRISGASVSLAHLVVGQVVVGSKTVRGVPYCDTHRDRIAVSVSQTRRVCLRWSSVRMMRRYLSANRQAREILTDN
jgi:ribosomal protein S27E